MDLAVATNSQPHFFRQGIYHRNTYTMQATRYLIAVVVKLTAGMKHSHNNFGRRNALVMHLCGYTPAIIKDSNCLVGVDNNAYFRAVSGQGFIYRVINHLKHHMVEAGAIVCVANIHTRALANRI